MPDLFEFDLKGDANLLAQLRSMEGRATDWKPALADISEEFYEWEKRVFGFEGRPNASGKWKSLNEVYAAEKAKHYPGKTINRRTDALYESLTGGGEGNEERYLPHSLVIGSSVPYAEYVNAVRPLVDIPPAIERRWAGMIVDFVIGGGI